MRGARVDLCAGGDGNGRIAEQRDLAADIPFEGTAGICGVNRRGAKGGNQQQCQKRFGSSRNDTRVSAGRHRLQMCTRIRYLAGRSGPASARAR